MPKLSEREIHQKCSEFRKGIRNFRSTPELEKAGAKLVQQAEDHQKAKRKDSIRESQSVAQDLARHFVKAPISFVVKGFSKKVCPGSYEYVPGQGWIKV